MGDYSYEEYLWDDARDAAMDDARTEALEVEFAERIDELAGERFDAEVGERAAEIFDEHFLVVFRSKVERWCDNRWWPAADRVEELCREARGFHDMGQYGPTVVWSATCVEMTIRDLTLEPIFVGLFLDGPWVADALKEMIGWRWTDKRTRRTAARVLMEVAGIDLPNLEHAGIKPWDGVERVLAARNGIVHKGNKVTDAVSADAVAVASGLYGALAPRLAEFCGLTD